MYVIHSVIFIPHYLHPPPPLFLPKPVFLKVRMCVHEALSLYDCFRDHGEGGYFLGRNQFTSSCAEDHHIFKNIFYVWGERSSR